MTARLKHIAIAVPDLEAAAVLFAAALGASVSAPKRLPEHGVEIVMVELPNVTLELIHPLDDKSTIAGFLKKHPKGGLHHLCFSAHDMDEKRQTLADLDVRILRDGPPKKGAAGTEVLFAHPADFCGTLVEFESDD